MIQVFSNEWFDLHQARLLWLVNTKYGRDLFGVEEKWGEIYLITPNSYHIKVGDKRYICKLHINPKYAKNLKERLKWVWRAFHWFDEHIADRFQPNWNLGFPTYSESPDAGDAVGTTADGGFIANVGFPYEDWDTIQGRTNSTGINMTSTVYGVTIFAGSFSSPVTWRQLRRIGMTFDTSSLGSGAVVNEVAGSNFVNYATAKTNGFTATPAWSYGLSSFTPTTNNSFVVGDFGNVGSTLLSSKISYGSINASGSNTYTLNTAGVGAIDPTGITGLMFREATHDIPDVDPGWDASYENRIVSVSIEMADGTNPPVLNLDYNEGSTGRRRAFVID